MDKSNEQNERIVFLLENHLIFDMLKSGVKVEDVRAVLKIDKLRVNKISKILKNAKTSKNL